MASKRNYGARPFIRGELYKMLGNPIYAGEIHHKGHTYEGQHPAIVGRPLWNAVRNRLASNTHDRRTGRNLKDPSLLVGLLHDQHGHRLKPTHTVKKGKRYRYYVLQSRSAMTRPSQGSPQTVERGCWRIPAVEIEALIVEQLAKRFGDPHWVLKHVARGRAVAEQKSAIARGKDLAKQLKSQTGSDLRLALQEWARSITVRSDRITIAIYRASLTYDRDGTIKKTSDQRPALTPSGDAPSSMSRVARSDDLICIEVPIALGHRGVETKLIVQASDVGQLRKPDPVLVKLIANARRWWHDLSAGTYATTRGLAKAYGKDSRYVARVLRLAFLDPPVVEAIVAGTQPVGLIAQSLMKTTRR